MSHIPKVTIYKAHRNGRNYFVVSRREAGRRRRSFFESKTAAESEASRLRGELAGMGAIWFTLSPDQRHRLIAAHLEAEKRGLDLYALVTAPQASVAGDGPTLRTAIDELLTAKEQSGRSDAYMKACRIILNQFADGREERRIGQVGLADVEEYLASKKQASRSTLRARLTTLFRFAIRRGWIVSDPCAKLESLTMPHPTPAIFTIEQVVECLQILRRKYKHALPWFVLSTFCGLRPEEAEKTRREDIHIKEGWIKVEAQTSKVRQRRFVYPRPEAIALLARVLPWGRLPYSWITRRWVLRRLRDHFGWKTWPKDITRHTAASYWLPVSTPAKVAESLGHSERILLSKYKALVTKQQADQFWSLLTP